MIRALIVGGGVGGLAAAVALERAGADPQVFERAPAIREIGAGLSLWANAIRGLERIGLAAAIDSVGVAYEVGGVRTAAGATISPAAFGELRKLLGTPVIVVHRAELLAALIAAVPPVRLHLGAACVDVRETGSGVEVFFEDGGSARGDVLIGADGLHSVVRRHLHGAAPPRYAGCTAWRAVVPFDTRGVVAGESWGDGMLFGQVPISGNRVYWYATRPADPGGRSDSPKKELLDLFGGWHAPIAALIDAAEESAILRNDIYDRPPIQQWGRGRMTLLGDAAHPMTPFLGQGACQAIEDAAALGECFAGAADPVAALRRYESRRIRRANSFVTRSRLVGQIARLRQPLLVKIRNAALRAMSPARQARQLAAMIEGE